MIHPMTLRYSPGAGTMLLAGWIATLLLSGLVLAARVHGVFDFPSLLGGVFTRNSEMAFWLGFWLLFAGGLIAFPLLLRALWRTLPGAAIGFRSAGLKGLIFGLGLWILSGLLLPLLDWLASGEGELVSDPGWFLVARGLGNAALFALALVVYGVSLALVAAMVYGIRPLDTIGWEGHIPGNNQEESVF